MENQQIKLLLNKWEEIHESLTSLSINPIPAVFFDHFEQDMISFLREFYRLKEQKNSNIKTEEQHPECENFSKQEIENITNSSKKREDRIISDEKDEKENSYPDIEFYFSLNDKFYFLREIFNGNTTEMNKVVSILNKMPSLNDSLKYMENELSWDIEDPTIIKLINIIEKRFDNKKIWESYS